MRVGFARLGAVFVLAAVPAHAVSPLEVHAELSGYDLIWPSNVSSCCAFKLHLAPSGKVEVQLDALDSLKEPSEETVRATASVNNLALIRGAIEKARFFELPDTIEPDSGWHPHSRSVGIRIGDKFHRVVLVLDTRESCNDWRTRAIETDSGVNSAEKAEADTVRRACEVWSAVRRLLDDPRATVP